LWLNDTPYIKTKVSEQVNRKCLPRNTTVQLSTATPTLSRQTLHFQNFLLKNAYVTWRALCSRDAHARDIVYIILF